MGSSLFINPRVQASVRIWYTPDFYLTGYLCDDNSTVFSSAKWYDTIRQWDEFHGFNGSDHWNLLSPDL